VYEPTTVAGEGCLATRRGKVKLATDLYGAEKRSDEREKNTTMVIGRGI